MAETTSADTFWCVIEFIGYIVPVICAPVATYHNFKLYIHRNETFAQKRSLPLLFLMNTWIIFTIITIAVAEYSLLHLSNGSIIQIISINIYLISWWLILYFLITKNWLIYFTYYWTFYTAESQWQNIINSTSSNNSENWFIMNKNTWGNTQYCLRVFGIICAFGIFICLLSELEYVLTSHSDNIANVSMICLTITISPIMIFYAILVTMTPYINDPFFIHWEGKMHSKLILALGVTFLLMEIVTISVHHYNFMLIADIVLELLLFTMNYVSTAMIVHKASNKVEKEPNCGIDDKLSSILSDEQALHGFITHLSKELSTLPQSVPYLS